MFPVHLGNGDVRGVGRAWKNTGPSVDEVGNEVRPLNSSVCFRPDEVNSVDHTSQRSPGDLAETMFLHPSDKIDCEQFVLVGLVCDEKAALAKRICLACEEDVEFFNEELECE